MPAANIYSRIWTHYAHADSYARSQSEGWQGRIFPLEGLLVLEEKKEREEIQSHSISRLAPLSSLVSLLLETSCAITNYE